jgi:hypothetical protein
MLGSILDPALIERATEMNKRMSEVEAADTPDEVNDAGPGARTYGSLSDRVQRCRRTGCARHALRHPRAHPCQQQSRRRQCVPSHPCRPSSQYFPQWICACFSAVCASAHRHKSCFQPTRPAAHSPSTYTSPSSNDNATSIAEGQHRNGGMAVAEQRSSLAGARKTTWSGNGAGVHEL